MNLWKCFCCNWFWPILALILLYLLQMFWPGGVWRNVEADVASRIDNALVSNGVQGVKAQTHNNGRDVLLTGTVTSEEAKLQALDVAENVADGLGIFQSPVARVVNWGGTVTALVPELQPEPEAEPQPQVKAVVESEPVVISEPEPEPIVLKDAQVDADIVDGKVTLSGVLASQNQVDSVLASASARYGASNITNNLRIADDVQPLPGLSRLFAGFELTSGELSLRGNQVDLLGEVANDVTKSDIGRRTADNLGAIFVVNNRLAILSPEPEPIKENALCQTRLVELMTQSQVYFKTSSAAIKVESYTLLDQIQDILQQCPDAVVEVAGHTDATGSEAVNQPLSQNRAQAVVDYLIKKGANSAAISATGHGSSQPVATNATSQGRAQNRRIEFTIK